MKKNLFLVFTLLFVNTVFSQQDITPPELTNFSFVPDTIDVSYGSQTVNYTVGAKDNFSIYRILVQFISPDNQISRSDQKFPSQDTDSTVVNGSVTVLKNDAEGQWSITLVLFDEIGNKRFIYSSDLEQMGLQSHLNVISIPDTIAPTLTEFSFSPDTVNVAHDSQTVNYTVGAKDNFNIYRILVQFISPDNQISRSDQKFPSQDTDSTVVNGSVTVLKNDAEGQWSITLVLFDEIGNRRFIYSSDLEQMGLQSHLNVISIPDTIAPTLTEFSFSPDTVNVAHDSQTVNYTVGAKDNFNIYRILVQFISPDNQISRSDQKFPSQDTDSTVVNGSVTILENDAEGQWSITLVLFDEIGNRRFIYSSDLEQMGLQSHIFVTNEKEVELKKPNGGEILFIDAIYNIQWTRSGINNVDLEYSVDSGDNWIFIAQNIDASSGNYNWVVGNNPSRNCLLRISDSDDSQISDISDSLWVIDLEVTTVTSNDLITSYNLYQNYPNPFNPFTTIKFSLRKSSYVKLEIYNSIGELIDLLISNYLTNGLYEIQFDGSSLSSGIYYYRILTKDYIQTKKMSLIK